MGTLRKRRISLGKRTQDAADAGEEAIPDASCHHKGKNLTFLPQRGTLLILLPI